MLYPLSYGRAIQCMTNPRFKGKTLPSASSSDIWAVVMTASQASPEPVLNLCPVCGKKTRNPSFCTRSCAARFNNLRVPKRHLEGKCAVCERVIPRRNRYCPEHRTNKALVGLELKAAILNGSLHGTHKHSRIRFDARRRYLAAFPYRCVCCGYDQHIDVCHKRPIASFPLDTPILVVNSLDNLVGLCPNCHWEFDHGLLQL